MVNRASLVQWNVECTIRARLIYRGAISSRRVYAKAAFRYDDVLDRLNREIVRVLNKADVKERFFKAGSEVVASSPRELAATIKADMATMGKVIKDAGIRAQ